MPVAPLVERGAMCLANAELSATLGVEGTDDTCNMYRLSHGCKFNGAFQSDIHVLCFALRIAVRGMSSSRRTRVEFIRCTCSCTGLVAWKRSACSTRTAARAAAHQLGINPRRSTLAVSSLNSI